MAHHNEALCVGVTVRAAAASAKGAKAAKKPAKAILAISSGSCHFSDHHFQKTIEPERKTIDIVASSEMSQLDGKS